MQTNSLLWIVQTSGRADCFERTLASWKEHCTGEFADKVIVDDSGSEDYRTWLRRSYPDFKLISTGAANVGFARAMQKVFATFLESRATHCLYLQDDFELKAPLPIAGPLAILQAHAALTQMSFLREPWYPDEVKAGGLIQSWAARGMFVDRHEVDDQAWMTHRHWWTCNPSIFPRWIAARGWPAPSKFPTSRTTERRFSQALFRTNSSLVSGIWGGLEQDPPLRHIGEVRGGTGFRNVDFTERLVDLSRPVRLALRLAGAGRVTNKDSDQGPHPVVGDDQSVPVERPERPATD